MSVYVATYPIMCIINLLQFSAVIYCIQYRLTPLQYTTKLKITTKFATS